MHSAKANDTQCTWRLTVHAMSTQAPPCWRRKRGAREHGERVRKHHPKGSREEHLSEGNSEDNIRKLQESKKSSLKEEQKIVTEKDGQNKKDDTKTKTDEIRTVPKSLT